MTLHTLQGKTQRLHAYLKRHVGRRGVVLSVYSLVFLFVGLKSLIDPSQDNGRFLMYTALPSPLRGLLWLAPAVIGLIAAFRPTPKRDAFGFATLTVPVTVLVISYTGSFAAFLLGATDFGTGWVDAIEWLLILILLLVTGGWTEDAPTPNDKKDA